MTASVHFNRQEDPKTPKQISLQSESDDFSPMRLLSRSRNQVFQDAVTVGTRSIILYPFIYLLINQVLQMLCSGP